MNMRCLPPAATATVAAAPDQVLGEVDVSLHLASRPGFPADYEAESMIMAELVRVLATRPRDMAQALADAAMRLTGAASAGVSLLQDGAEPVFRWIATAGEYGRYLNGTMPRHFSPCGAVLARNDAILMHEPAKAFPYMEELHKEAREVLLVPFFLAGVAVGTVWVVHHDHQQFDREDLRVLRVVTNFASAAMQATGLIGASTAATAAPQGLAAPGPQGVPAGSVST